MRCQCWEGERRIREKEGGRERDRERGREKEGHKTGRNAKSFLSNPNKWYLILHKAENNAVR